MPATELFQPSRVLRSMIVAFHDDTLDLDTCQTVEVTLVYADGFRARVCSARVNDNGLGELPERLSALTTAWLWGEGAKDVLAVVGALDRSQQSRRVRRTL